MSISEYEFEGHGSVHNTLSDITTQNTSELLYISPANVSVCVYMCLSLFVYPRVTSVCMDVSGIPVCLKSVTSRSRWGNFSGRNASYQACKYSTYLHPSSRAVGEEVKGQGGGHSVGSNQHQSLTGVP